MKPNLMMGVLGETGQLKLADVDGAESGDLASGTGVRASEDLGDGNSAIFNLENPINMTMGAGRYATLAALGAIPTITALYASRRGVHRRAACARV